MTIKFDVTTGIEELQKLGKTKTVQAAFTEAFYNRGLHAVLRLQALFSAVLERGAREDVGASGTAAKNIESKFDGGAWNVVEGSLTGANALIRNGIKPGSKAPIEKLRFWAANKGVKLYYDEKFWESGEVGKRRSPNAVLDRLTSSKGLDFTRSRWFGPVGIKPKSSMKPSQVVMRGLYALRFALYKQGTDRPTSDWFPLHPGGAGRFEYGEYVFNTRKSEIEDIVLKLGDAVAEDIGKSILGA